MMYGRQESVPMATGEVGELTQDRTDETVAEVGAVTRPHPGRRDGERDRGRRSRHHHRHRRGRGRRHPRGRRRQRRAGGDRREGDCDDRRRQKRGDRCRRNHKGRITGGRNTRTCCSRTLRPRPRTLDGHRPEVTGCPRHETRYVIRYLYSTHTTRLESSPDERPAEPVVVQRG